jgi:hypothetical protein
VFIRFTALCNSSTLSSSPTVVVSAVARPRARSRVDVVVVVVVVVGRPRLLEPPFPCERMSANARRARDETDVATKETSEDNFYRFIPRTPRGACASRVGV